MKSQNWGTVICDECGTRVSVDDADSCYNAELDDVFFYCHKCIYDPMSYLPGAPGDTDEAVEQSVQSDLAIVCEKCGRLATYPVCECGNPIPRPPNR